MKVPKCHCTCCNRWRKYFDRVQAILNLALKPFSIQVPELRKLVEIIPEQQKENLKPLTNWVN
jgi:hypothetical protein